jgi:hypothetical protein
MNVRIFRILIILTICVHIAFSLQASPEVCCLDKPIFLLPLGLWLAIYAVLFISLCGLLLLVKFFRLVFVITVGVCLCIVALQGGVAFSALQNILVQIASGLYGAILIMAYFNKIEWRNMPNKALKRDSA